jgi:hypothetical protein
VPTDPAPLQDALARTAGMHGPGLVGSVAERGEPVLTSDTPFVAAAPAGG